MIQDIFKAGLGAVFLTAVFLTGCGVLSETGSKKASQSEIFSGETSVTVLSESIRPEMPEYKSSDERREADRVLRTSLPESFQRAYGDFARESAGVVLKNREENTIYAPMSLYYALAFSASGAGGETERELLELLNYESGDALSADLRAAYEALYKAPESGENKEEFETMACSFLLSNSLWADSALDLNADFADHGAKYFYSDTYQADLSSPETAKAMSDWVKARTNGLITPKQTKKEEDVLLSILNTVYFYDQWVTRFPKENTKEDIFTRADETQVACEFMNMKLDSHGFIKGDSYTLSSLGMKNGRMIFCLPDEGISLSELLKDQEKASAVFGLEGEDYMGEVTWKVPKFSTQTTFSLTDAVQSMGVTTAFGSGESQADFSGISKENLFISSITQDSRVSIDENGVEAAAFTEIAYCGAALPEGSAEMILTRPFLYMIEYRGQMIFAGICENPAEI